MKRAGASMAKENLVEEGEKFEVGKIYSVKLITGNEFNGIVLAYDPEINFVEFEEGTKPRPGNLKNTRMVNVKFITNLKYLGKVKDQLAAKKHSVNLDGLEDKENQAIRDIEKPGTGDTAEGQSM